MAERVHIHKNYSKNDYLVNFSISYLNKIFKKYDKIINKHVHPHIFRHVFVTEMMKSIKGKVLVDENIAMKMLSGHSGDMTQYYSHYEKELKEIMIKYHYLNALNLI